MRYVLVFLLSSISFIYAQTDWVKWEKAELSYEMPLPQEREYRIDNSNSGTVILTGAIKAYHVLISDVDGENCPFNPSCSVFLAEAVKSTNIIQGGLMFVDRFTRDINFFKSRSKYPVHQSGKLYDPVVNYTLKFHDINYIPHDHIVK